MNITNIQNKFWQNVFKAHIQLIKKNSFLSSPIFYNDNIKIVKASCFFQNVLKMVLNLLMMLYFLQISGGKGKV